MVAWNFHPETREPILKFEDLNVPPEIMDRLGLEPKENGIFILAEGDSKRTEYFNVLVSPVLNELQVSDYTYRYVRFRFRYTSGFRFMKFPVNNSYKARHD